MKVVEELFAGPVDVVGDIHGQPGALGALLNVLGYGPDGRHPERRKLVFVGDLVDSGPDSPGVVEQVANLVAAGNAQCVLGNHELDLLRGARKLQNDWFFGESGDGHKTTTPTQQKAIISFLSGLPLALEREDLRVVHACWHEKSIERLRISSHPDTNASAAYRRYRREIDDRLRSTGTLANFEEEARDFGELIKYGENDPDRHWPDARLLTSHATVDVARQMENPVAVLTSGAERAARAVHPAGGRFRFTERVAWWDEYAADQAVIVGHFWRLFDMDGADRPTATGVDLFAGVGPAQWLGKEKKVFCVDFSVGGRASGHSADQCRLAAMRWPEATVVFDNGDKLTTDYRS